MKANDIRVLVTITAFLVAGTVSFPAEASRGLHAGASKVLTGYLSSTQTARKTSAFAPLTTVAYNSVMEITEEAEAQRNAVLSTVTVSEDGKICGYTNLGVANVDSNLNIREAAGEDQKLVGKLPKNGGCEILDASGEWYQIQSGKVTGYVKGEFILTGNAAIERAGQAKSTVATVTGDSVNLRATPSLDGAVATTMPKDEELDFIENQGEWVKVRVDNDIYYVHADYVTVSEELPKAMTLSEILYGSGVSDVRASLVNYACQFIGNPYVWGGTSLTRGVDCSGFTMQIYAKYGISLPHKASAQATYGRKISSSEAKPGDLFFYSNGGGINHVAIYIGNGQVVHASNPKSGIKISNAYYRTPAKVVRLLAD